MPDELFGSETQAAPGNRRPGDQRAARSSQAAPRPPLLEDGSNFTFEIKWDEIPQETLQALEEADLAEDVAHPKDVDKLKLAVSKQVAEAYKIHRQRYARAQKTPGIPFYKDLTNNIFDKFKHCLKTLVNGRVIGDGKSSFQRRLGVCIENLCRSFNQPNQAGPARKIKAGRGVVGVLPAQYNPATTEAERTEHQQIKEYLINLHSSGIAGWDWNEIGNNMTITYSLQREDILKSKEVVVRAQEEEEDEMEVAPEDQSLTILKNLWPFLFEPRGLQIHHDRLTGRNLQEKIDNFIRDDLDLTLLFLSSSAKSSVKNLKLKQKLDRLNLLPAKKVLAVVQMLANTFNEKFGNLLLTAEVSHEYHKCYRES